MTELPAATAADAIRADKPAEKPERPFFSSGPCSKPPGWEASRLATASLGRSHRSKIGKARLAHAIALTRKVLNVPDSHRIAIVPGSDTGAVELAMWNLLGPRPVTVLAWETFGDVWVTDLVKQLKIEPRVMRAPYGELPDLASVDGDHDVVFTWNGTTAGVRVPDGDWIGADRGGLTICDATSAAFAQDLPFDRLDVVTFSWQKVLGSEAAHGVLVLGPRVVERLESHVPAWPLPKLFRITKNGKIDEGVFRGETINTPSMLAVEDCIFALEWADGLGGAPALAARADASAAALYAWAERTDWIEPLAVDPATRSNTSVCLKLKVDMDEAGQRDLVKAMESLLEAEGAAYDIAGHRDAPPHIRIWCGGTVETADIERLGPWLEWAFAVCNPADE